MPISENIFQKCLPAFGTDIARCGTVTLCDIALPESDELDSIFQDGSGNFRINDALFLQDYEIRACQTIQNGLYDFLMANRVDMSKRITISNIGSGLYEIRPFIQAMQKGVINNEFWTVSNGQASGAGNDWRVDVASQTDIPASVRWFHERDRVYIQGQTAGGTATNTAWQVVSATEVGDIVRLELTSQNDNSNLDASKIENPETGVLLRGVPNVNDYEEWCNQIPGLNTNKLVPFWIETTRNSLCVDELYEKYHRLVRENNSQYRMFGDVETVELNRQMGADFQRRWVYSFFYNKRLANQDVANYESLEQINTPTVASLVLPDEGRCVGRRANAEGVYEQLAECGRVFDLQGQKLNLAELHNELYNIMRIREANNQPSTDIDLFTDSFTAKQLDNAYINYFREKAGGDFRLTMDVNGSAAKAGKFGFKFRSYELDYPPITLHVLTHKWFDDRVAAAKNASQEATGRYIWILDFAGIYPGMFGSNRKVLTSGDVEDLAKVDSTYMCVMKVNRRTQTMTSFTWTAIVECPASNLILENISSEVPDHLGTSGNEEDFFSTAATTSG